MSTPWSKVGQALRVGSLKKSDKCERCGRSDKTIIAHHHKGYATEHQLDVLWVCWSCHRKEHFAHPELKAPSSGSIPFRLRLTAAEHKRIRHLAIERQEYVADVLTEAVRIGLAHLPKKQPSEATPD